MKKLYIMFGGNGFIGSSIYNNFLNKNTSFIIIDKYIDLSKFIHLEFLNQECIKKIDLSTKNSKNLFEIKEYLINQINNFDYNDLEIHFMHFASTVGVQQNLQSNFDAEIRITQNISIIIKNIIKEIKFKNDNIKFKIWYTSTSELYGENCNLIDQTENKENLKDLSSLYTPEFSERSHYIYQKQLSEQILKQLILELNKNYKNIYLEILVLFNVVGPGQDPRRGVFNKFILNILKGKECKVSDSIRRYIPIDMVINHIEISENSEIIKISYLTGNGSEYVTCSGKLLYLYIRNTLINFYPKNKNILNSSCTDIIDTSNLKEIQNRFDLHLIDNERFTEIYGDLIRKQILFFLKNKEIFSSDLISEE